MQYFHSYPFLHNFGKWSITSLSFLLCFFFFSSTGISQVSYNHGLDKESAQIQIQAGDRYYDSGGPGGNRLPDQPGNYKNCNDPFNESTNCTSVYTFCAQGDTVLFNFKDFLIVTGDRLKIYSGSNTAGLLIFDSQKNGVSINGMRLTTGTLLKSTSPDGCLTVEWFCTTIGNSIGWEVDLVVSKKTITGDPACKPICKSSVTIHLPADTCFIKTYPTQYVQGVTPNCTQLLKLFYPFNTEVLADQAINLTHVGQTFLYQVTDSVSSASCFGYLNVKSSNSDFAFCKNDTISCVDWEMQLPFQRTSDCGIGVSYKVIRSSFVTLACTEVLIGKVYRVIERTLSNGMRDTCMDTLSIMPYQIDSIMRPGDIKLSCEFVHVSAAQLTPDYLKTTFDSNDDNLIDGFSAARIYPTLQGEIFLDSSLTCGSLLTYTDFIFPACGNTFKIRRQWNLKNQCSHLDTFYVQNISVEDLVGPVVPKIAAQAHQITGTDCLTNIVLDTFLSLNDCSHITQRIELSYPDPNDPLKLLVVNTNLPTKLTLPSGGYTLKFTFSDACFNATRTESCLWISNSSIPNVLVKPQATVIVDPATCWARVYAKDFLGNTSNACCKDFHAVIASTDSIASYRSKMELAIKNHCTGSDSYANNVGPYTQYIDHWITAFVFKSFIDLTSCTNNDFTIRTFQSCLLPPKDKNFLCDDHAWFCYNTIPFYRAGHNQKKMVGCAALPFACLAEIQQLMPSDISFLYDSNSKLNDSVSCKSVFEVSGLSLLIDHYQESIVSIQVQDTSNGSLIVLPDVLWSPNSLSTQTGCCNLEFCKGETYGSGQWPGNIGCNCLSNHHTRFYGGPIHNSSVYDAQGYYSYPDCNEYNSALPKPIYCKALLSDTLSDTSNAPESLFYKPVFNKTPGANEFLVQWSCDSITSIQFQDSSSLDDCNLGTIYRTWTLFSTCGRIKFVSQRLVVSPKSRFEVLFPPDLELDCNHTLSDSFMLSGLIGQPSIKSNLSYPPVVTFVDSLIHGSNGNSCKLLQRRWTIKDPCISLDPLDVQPELILNDTMVADRKNRFCIYRSLMDNGDGIMYYLQNISFIDRNAPTLTILDTSLVSGSDCVADPFQLKITYADDCSPDSMLVVQAALDIASDGTFEENLLLDSFIYVTSRLPAGTHRVRYIISDPCANRDTFTSTIHIQDGGSPDARCITSMVQVSIPSSGILMILAKDFDSGSLAGCKSSPLSFSFSESIIDTFRKYSCDSLGTKLAKIWVTNSAQKQSSCTILLQVSAGQDACTASLEFKIAGTVKTSQTIGINGVNIRSNLFNNLPITNAAGQYVLDNIGKGQTIKITPDKVDDPLNGLSTIDLLLIEKHIKGQTVFVDPYILIAADINKSGSITVTDLIELRKLILGTVNTFPNNKPWIFLPSGFKFPDPQNPWVYPSHLEFPSLNSPVSDADFIGIKVGDVNNSVVLGATMLEERSQNNTKISVRQTLHNGQFYWSFYLHQDAPHTEVIYLDFLVPYGARIEYDQTAQLKLVPSDSWALTGDRLKIAWTNPLGQHLSHNIPLFKLKIPNNRSLTGFKFGCSNSQFLYSQEETIKVGNFEISPVATQSITAYPNPSLDLVYIKFYLEDDDSVKLTLTSAHGKSIVLPYTSLRKGYNCITLNKNDLGGPGQYYFTLQTNTYVKNIMFIAL